jgi:hypothetical protein
VKGFVVDPALQVIGDGLDQRVARLHFSLVRILGHRGRSAWLAQEAEGAGKFGAA